MSIAPIPWNAITPDLLSKYSGAAPRYTSYPTAPEWLGSFGPADYQTALGEASRSPDLPLSLYIHIPYCKVRCLYCGCASWISDDTNDYELYLNALEKETRAVSSALGRRTSVSQLHLGGGTPTTLNAPSIERLFRFVTDHLRLTRGAEVAVEVSPSVTTIEHIETMGRLGFNRISLGVQDFTPEVQKTVCRIQSVEHTAELVNRARAVGFRGVNIDLMYGLPKQRMDTWEKNLRTVLTMNPDRLAVFGYAHVPWMRPHQQAFIEAELPDTALRFQQFKLAHDVLLDAGYVYIGMDHFAKPEDELAKALDEHRLWRNFQGYTVQQAGDLIGLGVTAISDINGSFAQNTPKLEDYLATAQGSSLCTYRGMKTSPDDQLRRHVITNLMCNLHLNVREVESAFGIDFWDAFSAEKIMLGRLAQDGIVAMNDNEIQVLPQGRIFVRHVGTVFDTYTRNRNDDGPRFSKTV